MHASPSRRPPSSAFKPILPKLTAYPRLPRKNENLLSMNGSPLMFPPSFSFDDTKSSLVQSSSRILHDDFFSNDISVRRDPSFMSASSQETQSDSAQHDSRMSPSKSSISAVIRVPTKDGHVLEFDPFLTSPSRLDSLEGITGSAKKQAKEEMSKLVQSALNKWKIS